MRRWNHCQLVRFAYVVVGISTLTASDFAVAMPAPDAGLPGGQPVASLTKEGRISVVRSLSGRLPQLTDREGRNWLILGPRGRQLVRANAHTVRVWGTKGEDKMMMPAIVVAGYELLEVDGKRPHVGRFLRDSEGRYLLDDGQRMFVVAAKSALHKAMVKRVGCKIWALARQEGRTLHVYKYGWLSCLRPSAPASHQKEKKK